MSKRLPESIPETLQVPNVRRRKVKTIQSIPLEHRVIFNSNGGGVSPLILKELGRENILLTATPELLASLNGSPLIVDTGDPALDTQLSGFYNVSTGPGKRAIYKAIPSAESGNHQRLNYIQGENCPAHRPTA